MISVDFVLGSAWKSNFTWDFLSPNGTFGVFVALKIWEEFRNLAKRCSCDILDVLDGIKVLLGHPILEEDCAVGIGNRDWDSTEFKKLLACTLSNVTRARNHAALALDVFFTRVEHFAKEVDETKASSFWALEGTTESESFAGKNTFEDISDTLVLAEEITDFTSTNTNITSWNISISTDMAVKFGHEGLAETHNFTIGLASWVEIGTTFATTHWESSKGILEDLFKAEEFEDRKVNIVTETKTTLVWADS